MNQALDANSVTLINVLTCDPVKQNSLLDLLRDNTETVITKLDGWISTSFIASTDGERVVIVSKWRDRSAAEAMQGEPRMGAYFPRIAALASFDSIAGQVAYSRFA